MYGPNSTSHFYLFLSSSFAGRLRADFLPRAAGGSRDPHTQIFRFPLLFLFFYTYFLMDGSQHRASWEEFNEHRPV